VDHGTCDKFSADDCALLAQSEAEAQQLFTRFYTAVTCFDLTVSMKKTEVMVSTQPKHATYY